MEYAIFALIIVDILAILLLHPLLYKPMFGNSHDRQDANPWQQYWGESYGQALKQQLLKSVLSKLETEEKIGNLIIDVGSGASPVTQPTRVSKIIVSFTHF